MPDALTAFAPFALMTSAILLMVFGILALFTVVGGWTVLAKVHRATAPPSGEAFRGVHGRVGATTYKGLSVAVGAAGLHLRFVLPRLHPPLFVPWSAVGSVQMRRSFGSARATIVLKDGRLPTIALHGKAAEAVDRQVNAHPAGA